MCAVTYAKINLILNGNLFMKAISQNLKLKKAMEEKLPSILSEAHFHLTLNNHVAISYSDN